MTYSPFRPARSPRARRRSVRGLVGRWGSWSGFAAGWIRYCALGSDADDSRGPKAAHRVNHDHLAGAGLTAIEGRACREISCGIASCVAMSNGSLVPSADTRRVRPRSTSPTMSTDSSSSSSSSGRTRSQAPRAQLGEALGYRQAQPVPDAVDQRLGGAVATLELLEVAGGQHRLAVAHHGELALDARGGVVGATRAGGLALLDIPGNVGDAGEPQRGEDRFEIGEPAAAAPGERSRTSVSSPCVMR